MLLYLALGFIKLIQFIIAQGIRLAFDLIVLVVILNEYKVQPLTTVLEYPYHLSLIPVFLLFSVILISLKIILTIFNFFYTQIINYISSGAPYKMLELAIGKKTGRNVRFKEGINPYSDAIISIAEFMYRDHNFDDFNPEKCKPYDRYNFTTLWRNAIGSYQQQDFLNAGKALDEIISIYGMTPKLYLLIRECYVKAKEWGRMSEIAKNLPNSYTKFHNGYGHHEFDIRPIIDAAIAQGVLLQKINLLDQAHAIHPLINEDLFYYVTIGKNIASRDKLANIMNQSWAVSKTVKTAHICFKELQDYYDPEMLFTQMWKGSYTAGEMFMKYQTAINAEKYTHAENIIFNISPNNPSFLLHLNAAKYSEPHLPIAEESMINAWFYLEEKINQPKSGDIFTSLLDCDDIAIATSII